MGRWVGAVGAELRICALGGLGRRGEAALELASVALILVGELGSADLDILLPVVVGVGARSMRRAACGTEWRLGLLAREEE
eukprot:scaffold65805_cov31-Tisochrysis_lutea.AAC.2